ncbi:MAG: VWA domain-containing protein [Bdellovibrionaceae bacterium]|nr:VWA domain-containing protein [Pseudobdellovibrionaceae bacterium]
MTWHDPAAFFLILVLVAILVYRWFSRARRIPTLQLGSLAALKGLKPSPRSRLMIVPIILQSLALIFMIVALARPREADTKVRRNVEGIDIVVALDVSDSMLIEDMKPLNRLEAAKEVIRKFVEGRASDRIGIVIFAGESFTLVPPTLDYPLLLNRISEITTAQEARIKDGTAIGVALANAAGRLKDSTAKSRVIIFLTDGENNSGTIDPETALEIAKGYGLKIYSIGIGRDGPTRIPIYQRDVFGQRVKTYQPFESSVNEGLLGKMAKDTGGVYYRATKEDALQGVFSEINSLEKTKVEVNRYTRYTEIFPPWLWAGILCYAAALILSRTWLRRSP